MVERIAELERPFWAQFWLSALLEKFGKVGFVQGQILMIRSRVRAVDAGRVGVETLRVPLAGRRRVVVDAGDAKRAGGPLGPGAARVMSE